MRARDLEQCRRHVEGEVIHASITWRRCRSSSRHTGHQGLRASGRLRSHSSDDPASGGSGSGERPCCHLSLPERWEGLSVLPLAHRWPSPTCPVAGEGLWAWLAPLSLGSGRLSACPSIHCLVLPDPEWGQQE